MAEQTNPILTKAWLEKLVENNKKYIAQGSVADYIPELTKVDREAIALSIFTPEGQFFHIGEATKKFTIQSISKIITLMLAVEDWGEATVYQKVGYSGTNFAFNQFSHFETEATPINPMMNAGALVTTALIKGLGDEAFNRILQRIQWITNNPTIAVNEAVYNSERETGHRNRGMFHMLKNKDLITKDERALNTYFKQCSIEVTTIDLAKIAYFFANEGIRFDGNTGLKSQSYCDLILSQMLTAGMYDYCGAYSRTVGIPSKSGVGGGILAADPHSGYGIAVFNPALDKHGSSAAGYKILVELSQKLQLSIFKK